MLKYWNFACQVITNARVQDQILTPRNSYAFCNRRLQLPECMQMYVTIFSRQLHVQS